MVPNFYRACTHLLPSDPSFSLLCRFQRNRVQSTGGDISPLALHCAPRFFLTLAPSITSAQLIFPYILRRCSLRLPLRGESVPLSGRCSKQIFLLQPGTSTDQSQAAGHMLSCVILFNVVRPFPQHTLPSYTASACDGMAVSSSSGDYSYTRHHQALACTSARKAI